MEEIPVCIKLRYLYEWTKYCSLFTALNEGGLFSLIYRMIQRAGVCQVQSSMLVKVLKKKLLGA